jgi:hypothetical protein
MTLYQTVLLKMLDIISIRKTGPRAHTVWMWLMTFFLSWTCFRTVPLLGKSSRLVHLSHLVSFCILICRWRCLNLQLHHIDRTFNLSSCFLTPLCFPNVNLESKRTSMPPVMLGPMLLNWDGNMDSYHKFTSHLQAKLADIDRTNLIFGSYEEFAAVKAVNLSFSNALKGQRYC